MTLSAAQTNLDTALAEHEAAGKALYDSIEAWLKAKALDICPEGVTLIMVGEAGEEWNTTYRANRIVDANGDTLVDLTEREDDDGPDEWSGYSDLLPELDDPDIYMGEHEIDLTG